MGDVLKIKRKPKPLTTTYDPHSPYIVERVDQDDGTITFQVQDTRPDSFRGVCSTSEYEGDNQYAKYDAEQIARALNFMVQFGKEKLPIVHDED